MRCVPPDLPAFLAAQEPALGPDGAFGAEDAAARRGRVAADEPDGNAFREALFEGQYAFAHFPGSAGLLAKELVGNLEAIAGARRWLERHEAPAGTPAPSLLEVGCGPGAFLHAAAPLFPGGALGLDVRLEVLRLARRLADRGEAFVPVRVEGRRFEPARIEVPAASKAPSEKVHLLQRDLVAPPLEAEAFPAVVAISLLDTLADPLFALRQLDALLAPGGLLFVASPWSWDVRVTPPEACWWSGPSATARGILRAALAGKHPALPQLSYELPEEADRLAWCIPGHERLVHRYLLDAVLARKTG